MHKFFRRIWVIARRRWRRSSLLQVAAIVGLWGLCHAIVRQLALAVPGGVLGMLALLAMFASGRLRARSVSKGANWLLAQMLLFFVPAVMVLMDMSQLLGWLAIKLLAAVVAGTFVVMLTTAAAVHAFMRWEHIDGQ